MPSRSLTNSEIVSVLTHLKTSRDRCLFVLGLRTGFRISELLSLRICDVWDRGVVQDTVTVKRCNMKGARVSRTVPLHNEAKRALEAMRYDETMANDRLFPFTRMQAHRILSRAFKAAGVKGQVTTHSMRKTFGQRVYDLTNKDIVAAQLALGHKSLSSTTHYLSVGQDVVNNAILKEED